MEKNKTSKYFKYAIGEIIHVMIGILLAIPVNNWNNLRKESLIKNNLLNALETISVNNQK
ncbi:hypothetical protein V8G56_05320 [Gaetbulibacter aquiaggeris]|uniref:Uncharacterized protein n=1 Tax=Gaetbulibacter aquiaggeris TaxID=1735373 RepID=A0ABW7MMW2_9FLAO